MGIFPPQSWHFTSSNTGTCNLPNSSEPFLRRGTRRTTTLTASRRWTGKWFHLRLWVHQQLLKASIKIDAPASWSQCPHVYHYTRKFTTWRMTKKMTKIKESERRISHPAAVGNVVLTIRMGVHHDLTYKKIINFWSAASCKELVCYISSYTVFFTASQLEAGLLVFNYF